MTGLPLPVSAEHLLNALSNLEITSSLLALVRKALK